MPPINAKNISLSPAASDLGLGDQLKTQLDLEEEERKKKLLQAAGKGQALGGLLGGPAISPVSGTAAAAALGIR